MQHRLSEDTTYLEESAGRGRWLDPEGFKLRLLLLSFALAVLAVISRRPDAIFNPQFYGEDGNIWFADAYNFGWLHALTITHTGYFQTLPRLGAALALLVPLEHAPLVTNLLGLIVQVAPAVYLVSYRARSWAPLKIRLLLALFYIALPNTSELNVSITEAQWHLALLACLVVLSCPPRTRLEVAFDLTTISLCGLTGPFCIVLFPAALIMWWRERSDGWRVSLLATLGLTSLLQGISLLNSAAQTRAPMPLGASFNLLCRILVSEIFLGPLLGINGAFRRSDAYIYFATAAGVGLLVYCCARAPVEWKVFIGFSSLIFAASMISPQASYDLPQWVALAGAWGTRYWFFPMLAFVWALTWCAGVDRNRLARVLGLLGLLVMCTRIRSNWRYDPYIDLHFPAEVRSKFNPARSKTTVSLPIVPGHGWDVTLKKK